MLVDALLTRLDRERVLERLAGTSVYCRGPKPLAVWRELGLVPAGVAPEPNTSKELLELLTREATLAHRRVFVQEYGTSSPELLESLTHMGAVVHTIPVYAWTLPDDVAPLEHAVNALCVRAADAIVFTSAQQLEHLVSMAERMERADDLVRSLTDHVVVASIGPVTSDALRRHGLAPDLTAEHPKMGQLISDLAKHWPRLAPKGAPPPS
jgi:uroporphyrinogen-III synthase